eukprot:TRINITY_DN31410_c0_g1_i1.p1 TRINITY_DN31410_c0_g1~~TRINITY_DN31410_c0_g1_i1.p1  ORF type:complete len:229 (-),score=64.99 TRINITY_DN31410_c0_g1_i1:180-866(-)
MVPTSSGSAAASDARDGSAAASQIREAIAFKEAGNGFVKEGNYKKALGSYHKVFCYVNGLQIPGEQSEAASYTQMMGSSNPATQVPKESVEEVRQLKASTHLNMALCYSKVNNYAKCVDACTQALSFGATMKAHYRRGQAHLELRHLDEAKHDFEEADRLEPGNQAIVAEMRRLKAAFAQHDAKERKRYAKMFSKNSEAAEAEPSTSAAPEEASAPDSASALHPAAEN